MFEEVIDLINEAIESLDKAYELAECDTAKGIRKIKDELENLVNY